MLLLHNPAASDGNRCAPVSERNHGALVSSVRLEWAVYCSDKWLSRVTSCVEKKKRGFVCLFLFCDFCVEIKHVTSSEWAGIAQSV